VCSNAQALKLKTRRQLAHQRTYGLFPNSACILHTHLSRNMVAVPGCRDTCYPRFRWDTRHEALEPKGTANTSFSPSLLRSRHPGLKNPHAWAIWLHRTRSFADICRFPSDAASLVFVGKNFVVNRDCRGAMHRIKRKRRQPRNGE
jgi:hypothetical protein